MLAKQKQAFRLMRAKRACCSASEARIFAPGPVGGIASETEGKTKAGQGRAKQRQGRAKQRQGRAGQCRAGQGRAGQEGRAGQDMTKKGKAKEM